MITFTQFLLILTTVKSVENLYQTYNRLEVLEELEDEEASKRSADGDEREDVCCSPSVRSQYHRHYQKWAFLTISVLLGDYRFFIINI